MTHNTSKFQIGGGLESADIGVLVRGVKNENFPCPARLLALKNDNPWKTDNLGVIGEIGHLGRTDEAKSPIFSLIVHRCRPYVVLNFC